MPFDDFRKQMVKLARPNLLQKMIRLLPGMSVTPEGDKPDLRRLFGMIDSMTPGERADPKIIDRNRSDRIARGAGVHASEVFALVQQFYAMKWLTDQLAGRGRHERWQLAKYLSDHGFVR